MFIRDKSLNLLVGLTMNQGRSMLILPLIFDISGISFLHDVTQKGFTYFKIKQAAGIEPVTYIMTFQ